MPTNEQMRIDGTLKGPGYFGALKLPSGHITSEYSIGINFDGVETQIPTLVPTLTKEELDLMTQTIIPNKMTVPQSIMDKAIEHAKKRMEQGKSPFADLEDTTTEGFINYRNKREK
jgi:hypothetical protein